MNALDRKSVMVRNPMYPTHVSSYDLSQSAVDAFVFWSKDYSPIFPYLRRIMDRYPTYYYATVTPYGTDVEPGSRSMEESVAVVKHLSSIVGRRRVAWRYDPIFFGQTGRSFYNMDYHMQAFEWLCHELGPYVSRCVFRFLAFMDKIYDKVSGGDAVFYAPEAMDRRTMIMFMKEKCNEEGIELQSCRVNGVYEKYGVLPSCCLDLSVIGAANDIAFKELKHAGNGKGCGCIAHHDIGRYNSCPGNCRYCYANSQFFGHQMTVDEIQEHYNPGSLMLLDDISESDLLSESKQRVYRETQAVKPPDNAIARWLAEF